MTPINTAGAGARGRRDGGGRGRPRLEGGAEEPTTRPQDDGGRLADGQDKGLAEEGNGRSSAERLATTATDPRVPPLPPEKDPSPPATATPATGTDDCCPGGAEGADRSVVVSDDDDDGGGGISANEDDTDSEEGEKGGETAEDEDKGLGGGKSGYPGTEDVADLARAVGDIQIEPTGELKPSPSLPPYLAAAAPSIPDALQTVAEWIRNSTNILVLSGAGVSVAAGIPDFRSPGTGLYDNLQKYNLPYPEAVFEVKFYQRNPHPFLNLAKELWPSGRKYYPTLTHSFLALLAHKKRLLRNYTQNIDGLEYLANIPDDLLVECHGHFRTASCLRCKRPADAREVERTILQTNDIPTCSKPHCGGYVKPDIVFFGESLPDRFHNLWQTDTAKADLCLVLGTSLQVAPVSQLPDLVDCPRVLLNREPAGTIGTSRKGRKGRQDLFHPGDCDDSVEFLAHALGWHPELRQWHADATSRAQSSTSNTTTGHHS